MATDDLAVALDEIRDRGYENGAFGAARLARLSDSAAVDVPRLLAALDEVLALTSRWAQFGDGSARFACAAEAREAISRALLMPIRSAG